LAAGHTRIIRSIALAGVLAIVSCIRHSAWLPKPSSLRAVGAQLDDLGDRRIGVVGIAIVAAVDERLAHLLAKRAIVGEGQHRVDRRARVLDQIAGLALRLGGRGGSGLHVGGTPFISASVTAR
jgi:hypothetical protein